MNFIDTPEQGHSFIDDEVDSLPGVQAFQNPNPLKVQAAMLSLTQKSYTQAHDSYVQMLEGGFDDVGPVFQKTQAQAEEALASMKASLPMIVTDPSLSPEKKMEIISAVRDGKLKAPDVSQRLLAEAGSREHGGDAYTDKVVLKTVEQLTAEAMGQWEARQAVVNAATASHDGTLKKISDFVGLFAPMGDGYMMARIAASKEGKNAGAGGILYSLALPGSSFADFHKKFHEMSYDEQTATLKELTDIIQASSSLMTSDNQVRAAAFLSNLQDPEYSNFEKYWDNSTNILDAIGLAQLIRSGPALIKGAVAAGKGLAERSRNAEALRAQISQIRQEIDIPFDNAPNVVSGDSVKIRPDDLAQIKSTPKMKASAARIEELEKKHASLLEENLVPLEKGEVTNLLNLREQLVARLKEQPEKAPRQRRAVDALKDRNLTIEAQIRRIDDALEQNMVAQRNIQEISSIEKELASLRKAPELIDIPQTEMSMAVQRALMQGTVAPHNPRTAGNIVMNANPGESRMLHSAVMLSEGDEMATALYGVSRNEALIKNVAPQVTDSTGRVKFVTPDIEQNLRRSILRELDDTIYDPDSGLRFSEAELASARANIVNDYSSAVGVKLHPAMTSVSSEMDGSRVRINAVYTAGDTGWLTPEEAISQTAYALRGRGITSDNITVMKRDGDEFVPVDAKQFAGVEGEYVARVSADEYVDLDDIKDFESINVKRNFLDRFFGTGENRWGSLQSHVLPITSMLHPRIVSPAMVADDKISLISEALLRKLDTFAKGYVRLPKARQAKMKDYIDEANTNQIPFNRANLTTRGFDPEEIDMLSTWDEFWSIDWKLENLDLIRTLNAQGFEWMDHPNFTGAVKPRPKNYAITEAYDPATDSIKAIDNKEIDLIYGAGGNIGELKRPIDVAGVMVENVIIRNTPSEYTRKLTPKDSILEKRDGYYQVHHKAPRFIDETYKDASGKVYTHTIATTGSIKDAKEAVKLLEARYPDRVYKQRGDERGITRGSNEYWDLNTSSGRIAQRRRSNLIQQNVGLQSIGATNYVENPVEAAIKAAASISGRTAMRPVLEAAKERFMKQYGHLVLQSAPGVKRFPESLNMIAEKGEFTKKEIADARTTWNYITYLENGYVNTVDDIYKNAMRLLGDAAGDRGWTKVERAARTAEEWNPTHTHKGLIFSAYLASNPFRQFIVQSNQGLRALAYNPQGFTSGTVYNYFLAPFLESFGSKLTKEQADFVSFMKNTGMYQAVSKNNLIRGTLLEASEKSTRAGAAASKVTGGLRRIGFDVGERFNLQAHAAAVYDEFVRAGKNVTDARVQAEMHDRVRAITLDMNFAGDMPYNQNALSLLMTYMQVPHKAISAITSRRIPADARNRMLFSDMMMWGVPTETIGKILDLEGISPEDPTTRRIVEDGLQAWYLNQMASWISGDDVKVDYSSLNPFGLDNWAKMLGAMWFDGGISKVIDSSAGSKIFGVGMDSRLGVALNMSTQFFKDFYENPDKPVEVLDVLDSWARISSGWNNLQKARMQWALGVAKDKYGMTTDSEVHKAEAVAQFFGFGSEDTRSYYQTLDSLRKSNKAIVDLAKDDVNKLLQLTQIQTNGSITAAESLRMHSKMMMSTGRFISPTQRALYIKEVSDRLVNTPENAIMKEIVKSMGFPDNNQVLDTINRAPIPEASKEQARRVFRQTRETIQQLRKEQ